MYKLQQQGLLQELEFPLYLTGDRNTPFTTFPSGNYAGKIFGTEYNGGLLNKRKIRICFID